MLNLKTHCLLIFILPFDPVIQIHMAACLYLQVFTSKSLQENQQPLCSLHGICKTSFYFNLILKARYHLQPWGFGTLQSAAFKLFQGLIWHSCRILVCVCVFLYIDIHGFFFWIFFFAVQFMYFKFWTVHSEKIQGFKQTDRSGKQMTFIVHSYQ